MEFLQRAFAALPPSDITVEQRIEALRVQCNDMDTGIWIAPPESPNLLCVATINMDFVGRRLCHVWCLVALSGAKTKEFIFSTLMPWCNHFCVDKVQLWDTVGTRQKARLLTGYGMKKIANVWSLEI